MCFVGQKSIFHHYYIQNIKDGIQFRVYKINNESVVRFYQFISLESYEKFKKISDSISGKVKKIEARAK